MGTKVTPQTCGHAYNHAAERLGGTIEEREWIRAAPYCYWRRRHGVRQCLAWNEELYHWEAQEGAKIIGYYALLSDAKRAF